MTMHITAATECRCSIRPRLGMVRLTDTLSIATDVGLRLHVPVGFWSDGASVPAPLWSVLDASPIQLLIMGIAHDYTYRSDTVWSLAGGAHRAIERPEADDLAKAMALWSGCSALDSRKIRYGLGVAGGPSWHRKPLAWRP